MTHVAEGEEEGGKKGIFLTYPVLGKHTYLAPVQKRHGPGSRGRVAGSGKEE